jgi:hypothetical protein
MAQRLRTGLEVSGCGLLVLMTISLNAFLGVVSELIN